MKNLVKNIIISALFIYGVNPLYAEKGHDESHEKHNEEAGHNHGHNHGDPSKLSEGCYVNVLHSHIGVTKEDLEKNARQKIKSLVQEKQIDSSWLKAPIIGMDKKKFQYSDEWIVNFQNLSVKNKKKQIIYVFLDLRAIVTGANYTGK